MTSTSVTGLAHQSTLKVAESVQKTQTAVSLTPSFGNVTVINFDQQDCFTLKNISELAKEVFQKGIPLYCFALVEEQAKKGEGYRIFDGTNFQRACLEHGLNKNPCNGQALNPAKVHFYMLSSASATSEAPTAELFCSLQELQGSQKQNEEQVKTSSEYNAKKEKALCLTANELVSEIKSSTHVTDNSDKWLAIATAFGNLAKQEKNETFAKKLSDFEIEWLTAAGSVGNPLAVQMLSHRHTFSKPEPCFELLNHAIQLCEERIKHLKVEVETLQKYAQTLNQLKASAQPLTDKIKADINLLLEKSATVASIQDFITLITDLQAQTSQALKACRIQLGGIFADKAYYALTKTLSPQAKEQARADLGHVENLGLSPAEKKKLPWYLEAVEFISLPESTSSSKTLT